MVIRCSLAAIIAVMLALLPVQAATFLPPTNPDTCKLEISGIIEAGDLERFIAAAAPVFTPDEEVEESTAGNAVCLNSPGGSYIEGVKIAKHFYDKGVGTVIEDGKECNSACALMFMMGRADGAEVAFVNRKLHIGGTLGFHRPAMNLKPGGQYRSEDIQASYDVAVSSVVEFVVLANKIAPWSMTPMVKSDLIEQIFATPGDQLFYIDTVEKAARWDIELVGVNYPDSIDEARAYYACENILQWEVGRHEEKLDYTSVAISAYAGQPYSVHIPPIQDTRAFEVTSRKSGMESAFCLLSYNPGRLAACAIDGYTGVTFGRGSCGPEEVDNKVGVNALAIWKPDTPLREINRPWEPESIKVRCRVLSGSGAILDDEVCEGRVDMAYEAGVAATVQTFTWPSGNRSVVRLTDSTSQLNGDPAERKYIEGFTSCVVNSVTGNMLCIGALD